MVSMKGLFGFLSFPFLSFFFSVSSYYVHDKIFRHLESLRPSGETGRWRSGEKDMKRHDMT